MACLRGAPDTHTAGSQSWGIPGDPVSGARSSQTLLIPHLQSWSYHEGPRGGRCLTAGAGTRSEWGEAAALEDGRSTPAAPWPPRTPVLPPRKEQRRLLRTRRWESPRRNPGPRNLRLVLNRTLLSKLYYTCFSAT